MKPNFALNLSHEGISLLHRAKTGWSRVGDVALDDPDLNDHLALMRKTAADLDSGGLTSKLVIPNSQILYTEVDAPGADTASRLEKIREGLAGLTPYDIKDLIFDWRLSGNRAQVAVVAKETLKEAEAFASEFRFNPVSFVALPQNGSFDGEPFFGQTDHSLKLLSDGETVEPDHEFMHVLNSDREPTPSKPTPAIPAPKSKPTSLPESAEKKPETSFSSQRAREQQAKPPKVSEPPVTSDPELTPLPATFSSRRAVAEPAKPAVPPAKRIEPTTQFNHKLSALEIDDVPELPAWRSVQAPSMAEKAAKSGHVIAPLPELDARPSTTPNTDPDEDRTAKATVVTSAALAGTIGAIGKLGQGTAAGMRRMRDRKASVETKESEAKTLTVFGARETKAVGGKPKFLGLTLAVLLLLAFGIVALWSIYFGDDSNLGALDDPTIEQPIISSVEPNETTPIETPPAIISSPEITNPITDTSTETVVIPESGASIDAAVNSALVDGAIGDTATSGTDTPLSLTDGATELALLEDPNLPIDDDRAPPDQIIQPPPTLAQAEASYAATGIWLLDPEPLPGQTGGDRLEDLYIASIDPLIQSQDAIALPNSTSLTDDLRPSALTPPAELGASFDLDERGLVRATTGGSMTPEGVRVYAGTPPIVPRLRPGSGVVVTPVSIDPTEVPEIALPDPERERLQNIRPRNRPATLQETNERSRLGGFSRTELALIRPTIRPPSVQEEVAEETAAATETPTDETATEYAVIASASPTLRPSGFSDTVKKALEEANRDTEPATNPAPAPNVAAPVVPSIPSRASVAKQATERNAIPLGKVNLIGVYGSPSDRRALVRLKSGRYIKVEVGDRVDGGRVAAIGDDELRYIKGGRNITLKMPKG